YSWAITNANTDSAGNFTSIGPFHGVNSTGSPIALTVTVTVHNEAPGSTVTATATKTVTVYPAVNTPDLVLPFTGNFAKMSPSKATSASLVAANYVTKPSRASRTSTTN